MRHRTHGAKVVARDYWGRLDEALERDPPSHWRDRLAALAGERVEKAERELNLNGRVAIATHEFAFEQRLFFLDPFVEQRVMRDAWEVAD